MEANQENRGHLLNSQQGSAFQSQVGRAAPPTSPGFGGQGAGQGTSCSKVSSGAAGRTRAGVRIHRPRNRFSGRQPLITGAARTRPSPPSSLSQEQRLRRRAGAGLELEFCPTAVTQPPRKTDPQHRPLRLPLPCRATPRTPLPPGRSFTTGVPELGGAGPRPGSLQFLNTPPPAISQDGGRIPLGSEGGVAGPPVYSLGAAVSPFLKNLMVG